MRRKFISTIVGFSVVLLSFVGAPAYGRGGGHGAAADTAVSAAVDTQVSAALVMRAELVVATVELELAMVLAAMARAIIHRNLNGTLRRLQRLSRPRAKVLRTANLGRKSELSFFSPFAKQNRFQAVCSVAKVFW